MKRLLLLLVLSLVVALATTGCWSLRYDTVTDEDYFMYPGYFNLDYLNSLAPKLEAGEVYGPMPLNK